MTPRARIPSIRDLLRPFRVEAPGLIVEVAVARAWDSLPAVRVTVANAGDADLFLESVGMVFIDGTAFGDWVGTPLPAGGGPHISWYRMVDLEARIGRRDPLTGLDDVFAAASAGTRKVKVDRRRLRAELGSLDAGRTG